MPDNNGVQYTNPPQSRNEELLEDIITDQPYTAPPQSEIEEILVSIIDETPYTKAPTSRNADLLLQVKEKIEEGGGGGSPIKLSMSFKNNIPSSAYGEIVLSAKEAEYSGNYDIMWGDASGVMSNYSKIDTVTLDVANNKTMGSIELMEYNAIPKYATRLCAVQNGDIVTSFNIPASKLWSDQYYGERDYGTLWVSDWHEGYNTAEEDMQAMLTYGKESEKVVAFIGAGDLTANGYVSELSAWKTIRDTYRGTLPFYTGGGNHEAATTNSIMTTNPTGLREYLDTDWTDETENYFLKEIGGDIYIFLSVFEGTTHKSSNTMLTSESLDWLEEKLELYRNQRVFLSMHIPPLWSLADMKQDGYPQGFGNGNGAYALDLWGNKSDRTRFLNMLDHYKNVIWLSGHSHIKYVYQKIWKHLNIFRFKGGARFVHLSSLTVPKDIIDGSVSDLIFAESEGTLVEVYDNHIRLRSRNFITEKFYGGCEYIIDTTPVTIPPSTKTLVSISAVKAKTSYYTDESASGITNDITVTATWSDNTTSVVNNSDIVFDTSNVDITTPGTYSIGINYTNNGVTETTSVQVTSSVRPQTKTLASLTASKVTTAYTVNESLSTLDITGVATYSDNTTANIANGDLEFDTSQVDMTTAGAYPIVVTYTEDGVIATATVGITVSSDTGGYTVVFDAEYDGTISAKGGAIDGSNITTLLSGMTVSGNTATAEPSASAQSKQLYVRLVSDTGISYSAKVGFAIGVGNTNSKFYIQAKPFYSYTSSSWTPLLTDNSASMELSSAHPLVSVDCKSSSSATATFPVAIKARIQIGYMDT